MKLEDNPLFAKLVGPEIGQFKLEREFKQGYFARTGLYALEGCTGGKDTIIKHTSYNRPDITVQDVKELALYGRVLKRVKATWSQGTVTDKLGVRGAFSWIERNIRMSNNTGKSFPIEYCGLRIGIVPKFFIGKFQLVYASYVLWRMYMGQAYLPALARSSILALKWVYYQLKHIFEKPPLLPRIALSSKVGMLVERDVSVFTFKRNMYHIDWINRWVSWEIIHTILSKPDYSERELVIALGFVRSLITGPSLFLSSGPSSFHNIKKVFEMGIKTTLKKHPEWVYYY
jgi:hypothetical protein